LIRFRQSLEFNSVKTLSEVLFFHSLIFNHLPPSENTPFLLKEKTLLLS